MSPTLADLRAPRVAVALARSGTDGASAFQDCDRPDPATLAHADVANASACRAEAEKTGASVRGIRRGDGPSLYLTLAPTLAGPFLLMPVDVGVPSAVSPFSTMSVPTAPGDGAFPHLVKTPVKTLGSRTENE